MNPASGASQDLPRRFPVPDPAGGAGDPGGRRPGRPGLARSDEDGDATPGPPHTGSTRRSFAYCSATDRTVPVLVQMGARPSRRRKTSYRDAEKLLCLDYGVRCTGYLCPLFDVPTLGVDELKASPHPRPS